jgi:hypothetical protein
VVLRLFEGYAYRLKPSGVGGWTEETR